MTRAYGRQHPGSKRLRPTPSRSLRKLADDGQDDGMEAAFSGGCGQRCECVLGCLTWRRAIQLLVVCSVLINIFLSVQYFSVLHQLREEGLLSEEPGRFHLQHRLRHRPTTDLPGEDTIPQQAERIPQQHAAQNRQSHSHVPQHQPRNVQVPPPKLPRHYVPQPAQPPPPSPPQPPAAAAPPPPPSPPQPPVAAAPPPPPPPPAPEQKQEEHGVFISSLLSGEKRQPPPEVCAPCKAKAHGYVPTTLAKKWPEPADCDWISKPGTFIHDYAMEIPYVYNLEEAKGLCVMLDRFCTGITCDDDSCTVRASQELFPSPSPKENSWLKDCPLQASLQESCGSPYSRESTPGVTPRKKVPSPDLLNAAIVILAHSRDDDLRNCLLSLAAQSDAEIFDIFVSIDVPDEDGLMRGVVQDVARGTGLEMTTWLTRQLARDYRLGDSEAQVNWFTSNTAKIAHHYRMVFQKVFSALHYDYGIFIEEDLVFSPDFLALFRSTSPLLQTDASIWCVSSWNDHGYLSTFSDPCRLSRTSFFPGLGFLLTRTAWESVGPFWPIAPDMGWDYWMRVAFREHGKECIIPELPRSHHNSTNGSSVTNSKQLKLFDTMAVAQVPNSCTLETPCHQFGDIDYLEETAYDAWLRKSLQRGELHPARELVGKAARIEPNSRDPVLLVPYVHEEYLKLSGVVGLQPQGTFGAIPQDVRAEHYGLLYGRHMPSLLDVILVDRRSLRHWLPTQEQQNPPPHMRVVAAARQSSCNEACMQEGMICHPLFMQFVNSCSMLKQHFPCEQGCAHQVGKELPAYVVDNEQVTRQQCLVTFISQLTCDG
eukprot:CAMPEP_0178403690 /NCGR_PEP_ID=MMETSP0689_2-20121128/17500_1 /TAXON_ID=160604 /ORGANISM="Amphidinium massartii, Strain CS-259" /LENGTH=820 /DNA_ID=CAMNT_0020024655 /DNA_START=62 /DNA_END=2521 /DNA_ORIENTATION=-